MPRSTGPEIAGSAVREHPCIEQMGPRSRRFQGGRCRSLRQGILCGLLVVMLVACALGPLPGAQTQLPAAAQPRPDRSTSTQDAGESAMATALEGLEGHFTRNAGQVANREVLFYARGDPLSVGLTRSGMIITMVAGGAADAGGMSVVRMDFVSCNPVEPRGTGSLGPRTSYFIGNDRSQWVRGAESYAEVLYEDLYDGVDLTFRFEDNRLKYDLIVGPGASAGDIVLGYQGVEALRVDGSTGDLLVATPMGLLVDTAPVAFQVVDGNRVEVPARFLILGDPRVGFALDAGYDEALPLVIDPGLRYSTFFGGTGFDMVNMVNVDSNDFVYIYGISDSPNFPVTPGAYNTAPPEVLRIFVAKLTPDLGTVVFCTFIGSPSSEENWAFDPFIKPLSDGSVLVIDNTLNPDFPVTEDAYCRTYTGVWVDTVLFMLSSDGSDLLYSTFFGGSDWDFTMGASVDDEQSVYLAGETWSTDLPTTPGAYRRAYNGGQDCFAAKMPYPYRTLSWCTYLGGTGDETVWAMEMDSARNVYVTGPTSSEDYPVTPGAYQPDGPPEGMDSYITKLDPTGSRLIFSTYIGGTQADESQGLVPTASGGACIALFTNSDDMPVTVDAEDPELSGSLDFGIVEVDGNGALVYSTYLGGSRWDMFMGYGYDPAGRYLYLTGQTNSYDFPTTKGGYAPSNDGFYDGLIMSYDVVSRRLVYSSYIGGGAEDRFAWGRCIVPNSKGYITSVGVTVSYDFPTTHDAFNTSFQGGGWDGMVVTVDPRPVDVPASPTGLEVEVDDGQLNLSWEAITDETFMTTGYTIYYGTAPDKIDGNLEAGTETSYLHEGLANGLRYYYQVTANNSAGESPRSPVVSAVPMAFPGAPQDLEGESGNGTITLAWSPPRILGGGTILGYDVLRGDSVDDLKVLRTDVDETSYLDADVVAGTSYFYAVMARNERGPGPRSNMVYIKAQTAPDAPTDLVATPGVSAVALSWGHPLNDGGSVIVGYRVYRGLSPETMSLVAHRLPIELYLSDAGLENGVTYYYAVSAFTGVAEGARTVPVAAMPLGPPGPPTGLQATPGDGRVSLAWAAPTSDGGTPLTGYRLYYGASPDDMPSTMSVGTVTSATITSLANGMRQHIRVTALNAKGEGLPSAVVSTTPFGVPGVPRDLTAIATEDGISLTWHEPTDLGEADSLMYRVLRRTGGPFEPVGLVTDATSYVDASVVTGTMYEYEVQALNDACEGEPTAAVTVLMAAVPGAPMDLAAFVGPGEVLLRWAPPESDGGSPVVGYAVLRGLKEDAMSQVALVVITEYRDPDVEYGLMYHYAVRAVNAVGHGAATPSLAVKPLPPPGSPGHLKVSIEGDEVTLTWEAPTGESAQVTGYYVLRGSSGDRLGIITELGPVLNYTDSDIERGRTYYYSVVARSDAGDSDPASPVRLLVEEGMDPLALVTVLFVILIIVLSALLVAWLRRRPNKPEAPKGDQEK